MKEIVYINGVPCEQEVAEIDRAPIIMPEIETLKAELAASDYKAIKYAEGWLTDDEYAPIKAERQALRDRINQLELELYGEI